MDKYNNKPCTGIYVKSKITSYILGNLYNDGTIHQHKQLKIVKKLSCKGCEQCNNTIEKLRQKLETDANLLDNLQDDVVYLVVLNEGDIRFNKIITVK